MTLLYSCPVHHKTWYNPLQSGPHKPLQLVLRFLVYYDFVIPRLCGVQITCKRTDGEAKVVVHVFVYLYTQFQDILADSSRVMESRLRDHWNSRLSFMVMRPAANLLPVMEANTLKSSLTTTVGHPLIPCYFSMRWPRHDSLSASLSGTYLHVSPF